MGARTISPLTVATCLNDGKGFFPACRALPTESATIVVAADFDGDSATDLFVPHRDGGRSVILWNDGKGNFPPTTRFGEIHIVYTPLGVIDVDRLGGDI